MSVKVDRPRRSFIKKVLFAAGAVLAVSGRKRASAASDPSPARGEEVLYRETEAFRAYYRSLRD